MAGKNIISVTFYEKDGSIRVSMGALECFNIPEYIRFIINSKTKVFGVEPTNRSDPYGVHVTYTMSGLTAGFRTFSMLLVEKIYEFMNWDPEKRIRVYGSYDSKKNRAIFDLTKNGYIDHLVFKGTKENGKKTKKKTTSKS